MRSGSSIVQLDAIDVTILNELQGNGRLTNLELAQRVHLSPSACLRRVKHLEEAGVIAQYAALLNPKAVGQHGTSFTIVNLETLISVKNLENSAIKIVGSVLKLVCASTLTVLIKSKNEMKNSFCIKWVLN